MRRLSAMMVIAALAVAPGACRRGPEGAIRVVVIGSAPRLADPAAGPLSTSDAVLLENVAQGLVQFDAAGNIVPGLAERWNVSDDGMSYIFRIASAQWPDGRKITAEQVARALKRSIAARSRDPLKDALGAVGDIVAMTDRVIEIQLLAPRPNLLALLAQPELAVLRGGFGSGPFRYQRTGHELRLTREIVSGDDETSEKDEVLLGNAAAAIDAVREFALSRSDLVLGGAFNDLPDVRRVKLPRGSQRFDPTSGLFGLVPMRTGGALGNPQLRQLLSQAIDRDTFVAALGAAGLAPRATLLEPALDGIPPPVAPAWTATPFNDRLAAIRPQVDQLFGKAAKPAIRIVLPAGPGSDLLLQLLARDWGALGFTVERARSAAAADFALVDEVAPSSSPAWFVRRFRCDEVAVCDTRADELMDAARQSPVPAQRYALLVQAAARIDDAQLFLPITAPVRWSLVSSRIVNFAGNRYARHSLTDLQGKFGSGD
jgi:peptide/nickel transport system substrate-binding protein